MPALLLPLLQQLLNWKVLLTVVIVAAVVWVLILVHHKNHQIQVLTQQKATLVADNQKLVAAIATQNTAVTEAHQKLQQLASQVTSAKVTANHIQKDTSVQVKALAKPLPSGCADAVREAGRRYMGIIQLPPRVGGDQS